jgi:hypothetical protein
LPLSPDCRDGGHANQHCGGENAAVLGELRNRLLPNTIKADVKNSIVNSGHDLLAKLER